jgi:[ribosomal protein S18]-alanine N-acetyltransferase
MGLLKFISKIRTPAPPVAEIRWMIRRDMDAVLAIEESAFDYPWGEEEFVACLRQTNTIAAVCEIGNEIAGYVVYEIQETKITIINLAVASKFRRNGFGTLILNWIIRKLSYRRSVIEIQVGEKYTEAHLLLRNTGFKAVCVIKNIENGVQVQDSYLFKCVFQF